MRFCIPLIFFLAAVLDAGSAHGIGAVWPLSDNPRFWVLGEGLGHVAFDSFFFQSRKNYDQNGFTSRPDLMEYTRSANGRLLGGFGFAPRLSLYGQISYHFLAESRASEENSWGSSNHGFGDSFVGFRWLVYRSSSTDRVYPSEWAPDSWMGVLEGTWAFPLYGRADSGIPPLGDQSNDLSLLGRLAWYTNEWLAFSASAGYLYRTANYEPVIPWSLRADFSLQERYRLRFWVDFKCFEGYRPTRIALNSLQPDPIPNGSLLLKSYNPSIRTGNIGAGYLLSREWELVGGGFFSTTGINSAHGWGVGLGIAWRPYQVPEIKYEEYRKKQIERLQSEKRENRRREAVKYGFRATIVKVSNQGNYIKIFYGEKDRVRIGDTFYVMPPDTLQNAARRPVAFATAVQVQPDAAYLHVDEYYYRNLEIREGFETRRVYFEDED